MENIKKALDVLDNVKVFWSPSQIQEIELAINALKKQLPQKGVPYNSAKNHNFVECSACNKDMDMYYKYCPHCGQKISWS